MGLLESASDVLGGGPKGGPAADAQVTYVKGEPLDEFGDHRAVSNEAVGSDPAVNPNRIDDATMEFVHYGWAYSASALKFDDPQAVRGLLMRDALEREAITLYQAMLGCRFMLDEMEHAQGKMGQVLKAVGNLLSGPSAAPPSSSDLGPLMDKVTAAGATLNKATISYPVLHKAGVDLHQARGNFGAFCARTRTFFVAQLHGSGQGPLGGLPGAGAMTPILDLIQKWGFKPLEVSLAVYLEVQAAYGDLIDDTCREFGLTAIRTYVRDAGDPEVADPRPTFPIWFTPPPPGVAPAGPRDKFMNTGVSAIDDPVNDVVDRINDAKQKVEDTVMSVPRAWDGFWGAPGTAAPGARAVTEVLDTMAGSEPRKRLCGPNKDQPYPPLHQLCSQAFAATMAQPPPFLESVMKVLCTAVARFLKAVYLQIDNFSAAFPLDDQALVTIGQRELVTTLVDLLLGFVPGGDDLVKNAKFSLGLDLSGQQVHDKIVELIDGKAGRYADAVLQIAVGHLGEQLEKARTQGANTEALTMEWFLGLLPVLATLLVRNLFFPLWEILISKVFGLEDTLAKLGVSPIEDVIGKAKSAVDDVREKKDDYADRAQGVQDQMRSVSSQSDVENLYQEASGRGAAIRKAARDASMKAKEDLDRLLAALAAAAAFPGANRVVDGKAQPITAAEADQVDKELVKATPP